MNNLPLIAHIIFRLDVGGLENGLVNILNRLPQDRYRHVIICLKDYSDFSKRITAKNVSFIAMNKKEGKDLGCYFRMWKLLRQLKPAIVHTRNLPALDMVVPAFFAGVPVRIHGEHGRDMIDIDGSNIKYQRLRRILSPLINRFIALSDDLFYWLKDDVKISDSKIVKICNGVDSDRFAPQSKSNGSDPIDLKINDPNSINIGTVGRMEEVKNTISLLRAFIELRSRGGYDNVSLSLIGDGSQRLKIEEECRNSGLEKSVWMPGSRDDIPQLMQKLDLFVLPSLAEGISNTILEAMASGLPIIATDVGGNGELVKDNGIIVPPANDKALADAIATLVDNADLRSKMTARSRELVEKHYSINSMVENYHALYSGFLKSGQ